MGFSLMIVDDSGTMRKIIMRTIRMAGVDVDEIKEAASGIEALEKIAISPVDMMLVDINMPGMGGIELIKKVRELPSCSSTKIIIVSTENSQEIIEKLIVSGADGYISKPFTPENFQKQLVQFTS